MVTGLTLAALLMGGVAYVGLTRSDTTNACVDLDRGAVLMEQGLDNNKLANDLWDLYLLKGGKYRAGVIETLVIAADNMHELAVLWKNYPDVAKKLQSASRWYDKAAEEMTRLDPNEHRVFVDFNRGNAILKNVDFAATGAENC